MLIYTRFQYNDMTSMLRKMFAPFGLIYDYILRSNQYLATLIAHGRTYVFLGEYAPRGDTDRADLLPTWTAQVLLRVTHLSRVGL